MQERTIIINGFSKTYSMTGWRLGYALGPAPIIKQMTKLHQFAIMSAPTNSQYAAIDALKNGDFDIMKMRDDYDMRRRFTVDGFRKIGLDCFESGEGYIRVSYCYSIENIKEAIARIGEFIKELKNEN